MKNYFKYVGGFFIIFVIGTVALWAIEQYRYRKSPEYQAQKYYEDLANQYANDTYGGDTPEETLRLFIDALKKGDVELASKYFVIEKQKEEGKYLDGLKYKNLIENMIVELRKTKLSINEDKAFFTLVGQDGIVESQLVMYKINNRWKISEL